MARHSIALAEHIVQLLTEEHILTASQLLQKLQARKLKYNKTSLYRALEKLLDQHQVCRQSFGGTEVYYELEGHSHDHFVCSNCARVFPVHASVSKKMSVPGYEVDHTHLTLFGKCQNCATT